MHGYTKPLDYHTYKLPHPVVRLLCFWPSLVATAAVLAFERCPQVFQRTTRVLRVRACLHVMGVLLLASCGVMQPIPDLGGLYNELAQQEDPYRNPVIVIPGILGSRLVDQETGAIAWGAFGWNQVNPNSPEGAPLVGLPMARGESLRELRDGVRSDGALDRVVVNIVGVPVELNAYFNILRSLGVGGYRDQDLAEAGAIDYGD